MKKTLSKVGYFFCYPKTKIPYNQKPLFKSRTGYLDWTVQVHKMAHFLVLKDFQCPQGSYDKATKNSFITKNIRSAGT